MGVIKNVSNLSSSYPNSIEDVLEEIENTASSPEPEIRRTRKIKQRSTKLYAIGGIQNSSGKGGKKKNRIENANYLISLADPDECIELNIHDFIPHTLSVFSQVIFQTDEFDFIWNEFMNCTDDENFYKRYINHSQDCEQPGTSKQLDVVPYNLDDHPAYTAVERFNKISRHIRSAFKKQHVPLGILMYLETELVTFFMNRPHSVFHCRISNSFERLLLHAVSQYLDLSSLSYDRNGVRWTRVLNKNPDFQPPPALLSSILEKGQKM